MRSSRTDSRGNLGFIAPSVRTPKICPEALGMKSIQSAPHRTSSLITRQTHYFTTDRGHQHGFISQFPQLSNLCLSLTQFAVQFRIKRRMQKENWIHNKSKQGSWQYAKKAWSVKKHPSWSLLASIPVNHWWLIWKQKKNRYNVWEMVMSLFNLNMFMDRRGINLCNSSYYQSS